MTITEFTPQHSAERAVSAYLTKYSSILAPQEKAILEAPAFATFVANMQMDVIGGSPHDHLDAATDEAVAWGLGALSVIAKTDQRLARQILWPTADSGLSR